MTLNTEKGDWDCWCGHSERAHLAGECSDCACNGKYKARWKSVTKRGDHVLIPIEDLGVTLTVDRETGWAWLGDKRVGFEDYKP